MSRYRMSGGCIVRPSGDEQKSYLADLAVWAAIEIDNHRLGRGGAFSHAAELGRLLAETDIDKLPFLSLYKALEEAGMHYTTKPALKAGLEDVGKELCALPTGLPERAEAMRKLLMAMDDELYSPGVL